jgi:hypothetical protein
MQAVRIILILGTEWKRIFRFMPHRFLPHSLLFIINQSINQSLSAIQAYSDLQAVPLNKLQRKNGKIIHLWRGCKYVFGAGTALGVVTRAQVGRPRNRGLIQKGGGGAVDLSLLQNVVKGFGAHITSYSIGNYSFYLGGKAAGWRSWPLTSIYSRH